MSLLRFLFACLLIQLIPSFTFAQNDAGVVYIDSLKSSYCGNASSDVYVRIKNFASTKQLDTVSIGWAINGTSQTAKQYTKAVNAGDTSTSFKLGNASFSSGTYKIKVWTYKPNNSTDANTSNDTLTFSLTVYDLPTPTFLGDTIVCRNTTDHSYYASYNSGSSYSWSVKGGTITSGSDSDIVTITWEHSGTGSISVTETNSYDCKATSGFSVYIQARPEPVIKSASSACGKMPTSFSTAYVAGDTYKWSISGGSITSKTDSNGITVSWSSSSGRITIKQTNALGCDTTVTDTISGSAVLKADFTYTSVCENDTTFLYDNSSTSSGTITSYLWKFHDGTTSTTKSPYKIFSKGGMFSVKLITTNSFGCTDSNTKTILVYDKPVALFSVAGACLNAGVAFSNKTKDVLFGSLTYLWKFGDGDTSTAKNPNHIYAKTGTYKVTLIANSSGGCKDSISYSVTVYASPVADFTFTNHCLDSAISFTNQSTGTISGYLWDFGDGDTSTLKNPAHNYKQSGDYYVKLISSNNCRDSITKKITVYAKPNPSVIGDSVVCSSSSGFNYYTSATKGNSYNWSITGGTIISGDTTNSVTVYWGSSGIGKISVEETNQTGCKTTAIISKITINPRPQPLIKGDSNTCSKSVTYNTTAVPGNSYSWSISGGFFSSGQYSNSASVVWTADSGKLSVTETNSFGCDTTVSQKITVISVKANFTFNASCNDTTYFTDSTSATSGSILSYLWKFHDGTTSTSKSPDKIYAKSGIFDVKLTVINSSGCKDSIIKKVTILAKPKADFLADNGCAPLLVSYKNNSSIDSGNSIVSYNWTFSNGNTSTQENPSQLLTVAGEYKVKLVVTANTGCKDSVIKSIFVYPNPKSDFSFESKCADSAITFTNKSTIDTPYSIVSSLWYFGDGDTSILENPVHAYAKSGQYKVTLKATSNSGCTDTVSNYITVYPLPNANFSTNNICVKDSAYFLDSSISGVEYIWDFGDNSYSIFKNPSHKYTTSGIYDVKLKVRNSQGCLDSIHKQIEVYDVPQAIFSVYDICVSDSFQFTDSSKGATQWLWNFGDNATSTNQNPSYKYTSAGKYNIWLIVSNKAGCKDSVMHTITVDSTCVWPGDANADKIVDNKDILAIGVAYSDTGSTRADTSTIWKANLVKDWSNNFASGANYKHADCNGDGMVGTTDTLAITRNYTKTHLKKFTTNRGKNTDPILKIDIQNDSLKAGDTLVAYILLGENALPAKDVYGLAFKLNYNRDLFSSAIVSYANSWLGNKIIGYSNNTNQLDLAITRTDHTNKTGYGKLATVKLIMKKDVPTDVKQIKLEITDNIIISADEIEIPVNIVDDSVVVNKMPDNLIDKAQMLQSDIKIYPNPFRNETHIEYNLLKASKVSITFSDMNGKTYPLLRNAKQFSGKHTYVLNAEDNNLKAGVYAVRIEINGQAVYTKIVKVK